MSFFLFIIQTHFSSFQYQFQFYKFALDGPFYLVNENSAFSVLFYSPYDLVTQVWLQATFSHYYQDMHQYFQLSIFL